MVNVHFTNDAAGASDVQTWKAVEEVQRAALRATPTHRLVCSFHPVVGHMATNAFASVPARLMLRLSSSDHGLRRRCPLGYDSSLFLA